MSLPEMLRDENPTCERRSVTPEEWLRDGKWTRYGIGPELAALVEAADELINTFNQPESVTKHYDTARAALAATLAQSLAAHDAEVLERAAKIAAGYNHGARAAEAIRALAAQEVKP